MSRRACEQLNDFGSHDLAPAERARFRAHLNSCDACRERVTREEWLNELVAGAVESATVPRTLMQRVDDARRTRRKRIARKTIALAALVLLSLGTTILLNRSPQRPLPAVHPAAKVEPKRVPVKQAVVPPPQVQVIVGPRDSVIAVPIETDHPKITMVWVYTNARSLSENNEVLDSKKGANE